MTHKDKRRFLYQYVNTKKIIKALLEDRDYWESVGTSMTAGQGSGSGKSSGSKVETSSVNISQIMADIGSNIKSCIDMRNSVVNAVEQVRTGKYKTVLYDVFIAGKTIEEVANERGSTVRRINGMIRRGLEQIEL